MTATPIALSVRDMHKSFGPLQVIRGISLDALEGDVVSIVGSSGSGKSTFLRCINLLETPDSGEVTVAGETISMQRNAAARTAPRIESRSIVSALSSEWCSRVSISGLTRRSSKTLSRHRSMFSAVHAPNA